jgi:hypothetical protein
MHITLNGHHPTPALAWPSCGLCDDTIRCAEPQYCPVRGLVRAALQDTPGAKADPDTGNSLPAILGILALVALGWLGLWWWLR